MFIPTSHFAASTLMQRCLNDVYPLGKDSEFILLLLLFQLFRPILADYIGHLI